MEDRHQYFLQAFMSRHVMDTKQVKALYKNACDRYGVEFDWQNLVEFINTINHNTKPYHLEIWKGVTEDTGASCYCLVNIADNKFLRVATDYTENELEFFKKVVEYIMVESEAGDMSMVDACNLPDTMTKKITRTNTETLIKRLITDGWLTKREGCITLSTRSILELNLYIREHYPENAVSCDICNYLCVHGRNCPYCSVKLHIHCAVKFFKGSENPVCPSKACKGPWELETLLPTGSQSPSQSQQETHEQVNRRHRKK